MDQGGIKRPFETFKPHEILRLAMRVKKENHEVFQDFAQIFSNLNPDVYELFSALADEDREHWNELKEFYRNKFGNKRCSLKDSEIALLIHQFRRRVGDILDTRCMIPGEALEAAKRAASTSGELYKNFSDVTDDPELNKIYKRLVSFCKTREKRVQEVLAGV